jgi:hypothetical protein
MLSYSPSATDSPHNAGGAPPSTHDDLPYQVMVVVSAVLLLASVWVF